MSDKFAYHDYVSDEKFLAEYNAYQARYAGTVRESDKVIISLVKDLVTKADGRTLKVLDIGCSTGNLLLHLKRMVPDAEYVGGDLAKSSLDECRKNPDLAGIEFEEMDILNLGAREEYDIVIANAVAVYFTWPEYEQALASVSAVLKPDGSYIAFEWLHPFTNQDLAIYETTLGHPEGIRICFRPIPKVMRKLEAVGLKDNGFMPFELPIDLPMPGYDEEVVTYTVNGQAGNRMMFRGALFQPWCHMIARKAT